MSKTTTQTTTTNTTDLYTQAEKAVYIALKARHEKSGLKFLADLQNAQAQDRQARSNTEIIDRLHPLENQLEELREERTATQKLITLAKSNSTKLMYPSELRTAWANRQHELQNHLHELNKHIKHTANNINILYDALNITYTDRADLTQTAIVKILELEQEPAPITTTILNRYGVDTAEELTDTERADAQAQANFRTVVNSVGKAISALASPEALNRTVTSKRQATDEEVQNWLEKYGAMGADFKVPQPIKRCRQSDCYDTMEYKDTKTLKGWYIIKHYKTVAPYQYIEDFNTAEDGENDINYIKSYNPFISNSADLDRIEELYKTADLTDRQRLFLEHFCRRCRVSADFKDCKNYAFSKIGITTESNKTTFFNRLKNRLKEQVNK